ncbi:lipoprotein-releasing ABC transporter permease subunit LolC [Morganella psychrotolerans]|uniref:Outer membrane-specific lipoprotein transporter subunit LolC n=1 Tax=Morganella psychrotolerans TaxID=368603 RepID=A0A1B8HF07_9GAMM|nr:lipoprotein-releasing ABC transporter permease subunit LolC [Morganella psychrotolerans]OBU07665.1 outer membrane-specific lipoprotein transporter subunit LolC [Morganella psychrotolerans]
MFQSVSFLIGLRYMRGRGGDRFARFVSLLSAIGITLGVAALITVTSVMNGFERSLQQSILDFMPQAVITTPSGVLDPQAHPVSQLSGLRDVVQTAPIVTGDVVLQSRGNVGIATVTGVDPQGTEPLMAHLVNTRASELTAGQYHVVLGEGVAVKMGLKRGDTVRVLVPNVSQLTPMGRIPSQRLFTVAGIFSSGSESDKNQILMNQDDAARLMRYAPGHITGWRLYLSQPLMVDTLSQQILPDGLTWTDWRVQKGEFFQAVRMEKNMMGLLLGLIIAVAAFNIVTSLALLVMEKQTEVAILKTLGMTRGKIMLIFIIQGAGAGILGSVIGMLLGVLLSSQLNILMPLMGLIPKGITLPTVIEPLRVVAIGTAAMLISLLSTLWPAWRAAAVQPAEALRYE